MFALAITTICGFLALAVDVGLAYSIRKSAQSAADAAALAGVQQALSAVGTAIYTSCPPGVLCQTTPVSCTASTANPPQTSIDSACLYASKNGFTTGSNNGYPQTVSVTSNYNDETDVWGDPHSPPDASSLVTTNYWVEVKISETIPYLFGGLVKNTSGGWNTKLFTVNVKAVAAITQNDSSGSTISTISLVR
jgi:Flp pilus assembly protein TadG